MSTTSKQKLVNTIIMTPVRSSSLGCWLRNLVLALVCQASTGNDNPLGPGSLNNLLFFQFDATVTLTCNSTASRCGFDRDEYSTDAIDLGGSFNEQTAGTVWTAAAPGDQLRLSDCTNGNCVAYCFADCSCIVDDSGAPCGTTTPIPTVAPVATPAPVPYVCPLQEETTSCSELMTNNLPTTDPGCDCYNFCDGVFLSCCNEISNSCGSTNCTGQGVFGCTKQDVGATSDNGGENPTSDNGSSSPMASPSSSAVASPPTLVGNCAAGLGLAVVALGL